MFRVDVEEENEEGSVLLGAWYAVSVRAVQEHTLKIPEISWNDLRSRSHTYSLVAHTATHHDSKSHILNIQ